MYVCKQMETYHQARLLPLLPTITMRNEYPIALHDRTIYAQVFVIVIAGRPSHRIAPYNITYFRK